MRRVLFLSRPGSAADTAAASMALDGVFAVHTAHTTADALAAVASASTPFDAAVMKLGTGADDAWAPLADALNGSTVFRAVLSATATRNVMALTAIAGQSGGELSCPECGLGALTEDALCVHMPLCTHRVRNIQKHIHDTHGPVGRGEVHSDHGQAPPPLYAFALCLVRRPSDGRFLLTQEYAGAGYWVPGGHVDAGETLQQAAVRETLEEAGVRVRLTGVLNVAFRPLVAGAGVNASHYVRLRAIFLAEPEDAAYCEPKTLPDFESAGAVWATYDEIMSDALPLRGEEPRTWARYVVDGGTVAPPTLVSGREL